MSAAEPGHFWPRHFGPRRRCAGVCSTCRAKITEGAAEMLNNNALEDHEVRDGYVLTCQCIPLTETIAVTYEI